MWKSYGRNNSIYDNLNYDAYSYNSSNIVAQCNWWGNDGAQTYHDGSSTVDASFPLTYDPWMPWMPQENPILNNISSNDYQIDSPELIQDSSLFNGLSLEIKGRIIEAIIHYKGMINNSNHAEFALGRLVSIMHRYGNQGIREYFESLLLGNRPYKPAVLTLLAGILIGEDKYNESIILYDRIINDYPDTYYAVNALF